jgi:iron complex transport system ATP-binding protein
LTARALGFRHASGGGVEGVDLDLAAGEIVGVLGPNGSGKTTLVRVLSGVLAPYRGSVRIGGRELVGLARRELARAVAVVAQEPVFDFPFTALETVLLGRHPHLTGVAFESARDRELAMAALERLDAAPLADRLVSELSAGERQRVVVARALAQETPVLLLDEPSSFLDLRHQVELFDLVRELAAEGRAVLAVVHDLNLAAEYCDRVLLLDGGRVAAGGPTEEVLTYANLKRVFGTEVYVDVHDLTGKVVVVPLSGRVRARLEGNRGGGA